MHERLLRDGCEAVGLLADRPGEPSSHAVRLWLDFATEPTGRPWYRAHNASVVGGCLERPAERFLMNVALVEAPSLAVGRLAPAGRVLGDPRLGLAGAFLSLRRVLPDRHPLELDVERCVAQEGRLGRTLDYGIIVPRLQRLYAWPFEQRHVWRR